MLLKEIVQILNKNIYYEKKIILSYFYNKYYIKKVFKKAQGFNVNLDNNLLNIKNSDKLPPFYLKKNKQDLTAFSINFKNFEFKTTFKLINKKVKLPYFSLNKSLQQNVQILRKKYLQALNTLSFKENYSYAKIIFPNKGGYVVKTFSGLRGFIPRIDFIAILTEEFFFFNFINNDLFHLYLNNKYNSGKWLPVKIANNLNTLDFPQINVLKKNIYNRKKFRASSYIFIIKERIYDYEVI